MKSPKLHFGLASLIFSATLLQAGSLGPLQAISDGVFHLKPQRPIEELRVEALRATPPAETGQFRKPDLLELVKLDATIRLDIRYATNENFLSTPLYTQAR